MNNLSSDQPTISVIIPSYNRKNIVVEAIQSVLAQEPKNYEVIVVDDGSTDGTREYLESLDLPMHVISKENGGVASARNFGIKAAIGKYIAFLDSDDLWLPGILKAQLEYLESNPEIPLVYTDQYIEAEGKVMDQTRFQRAGPTVERNSFKLSGFVQHTPIHISSVMVRRQLFDEVGYFNEDLKIHEDTEMWNRISQKYSLGWIDTPLATFRWEKDPEHLLKAGARQKFVDEGKKYLKLYEELKGEGITEEEKKGIDDSYVKIREIEEKMSHEELIRKITAKVFSSEPQKIERMKIGLDNEVYSVQVADQEYIIRLNKSDSLKGSTKYIPLFNSKGIKVPDIIADDYSKELIPFNYQVLSKFPGDDIGLVFSTLTDEQLKSIASEIADIVKKLITIPTNGKFGCVGIDESELKDSLFEIWQETLRNIKERTEQTKVVSPEYLDVFENSLTKYNDYFKTVSSQFYFDDMSSKNVIINNGEFAGLIDLDGVAYGDFLEGIGRIKASWYGTRQGEIYTNAVMNSLSLSEEQRKMVTVYALLTRIHWLSEIGIQFNQNTSTNIDSERVKASSAVIDGLINELG